MSTILKALRRLEEEKSRGATSRPLREEVASGPGEAPRRRLPWLPIAAMLVGAGLGASAWWVWPYERAGEPVRPAEAMGAATSPAPASAAAPITATQPVEDTHVTRRVPPDFKQGAAEIEQQLHEFAETGPAGPPEDAFASGVEVVERPIPTPRIEPTPPGAPQQRVISDPARVANEPPAVTARRRRLQQAAQQPAPAPTGATASAPDPVTAPAPEPVAVQPQVEVPAPRPTAAAARPSEPPAPARSELREPAPERTAPARSARASVPAAVSKASAAAAAVRVKRTQWHPEPGRRSADLDVAGRSQSVHEGDLVDEYVVTEIKPSGVVLTRDGEEIERKIGK